MKPALTLYTMGPKYEIFYARTPWAIYSQYGHFRDSKSKRKLILDPIFYFFLFFGLRVFLGLHPQDMEVPRLGGTIGTLATSLCLSHNNSGSEMCL